MASPCCEDDRWTSRTLQTIDVEFSADSVEWCGVPGCQNLLLCGTYQLEDSNVQKTEDEKGLPQRRVGRLYMYHLEQENNTAKLQELTRLEMPGILDIKWSQQVVAAKPLFGLVNSVGQLKIFCADENSVTMVTEVEMGDCLGLSLEWNNTVCQREDTQLVASDSKGQLHLYLLSESSLDPKCSWKAHDFEAWIAAFDQWNPSVILSGGDDCKLKVWDMRVGVTSPVRTSKRHTMGVCSIQSNPVNEHILATGSYDEQLLIWDTRHMKQPVTETALGGGIWRIKWRPGTAANILTATMYNGFHIVNAEDVQGTGLSIQHNYTEHTSIAYGADWCRGNCEDTEAVVATCSFYDHTLKLWKFLENKT